MCVFLYVPKAVNKGCEPYKAYDHLSQHIRWTKLWDREVVIMAFRAQDLALQSLTAIWLLHSMSKFPWGWTLCDT